MVKRATLSVILFSVLIISVFLLIMFSPANAMQDSVMPVITEQFAPLRQQPEFPSTLSTSTTLTSTIYLPLVANMQEELLPIVPTTTEILTGTLAANLVNVGASELTFTQPLTQPLGLEPGEIVVSAPNGTAPDGLLRKVVTVTDTGTQIVVQTTSASLEEALQQGEAHVSQQLTPNNIQQSKYTNGVTLATQSLTPQAATFYLDIRDVVLYDNDGNSSTTNDQVLANGSIEIEPKINFDFRIKNWKLDQLYFSLETHEKVEVKVSSKIKLVQLKREKELARYWLTPITVMVGPVPVVLTPILTFVVGVDGDVHVSLWTKVTQEATLTGGMQYSNGRWDAIRQYSNQFQFQPPVLSLGGDLKGYAGPQFQLLLYGVVGPQIKLDGYLKLEADLAETPWWKFYGGLEVSAAVRVEVLSQKVASYEFPGVIGAKWLLAQASISTPTPTPTLTPIPAPTRVPTHVPTRVPTRTPTPTSIVPPIYTPTPVPTQPGSSSGKYAGPFTNQSYNASGSVIVDISIGSNVVSGYINFTNNPGVGSLCGAGNFSGTRTGDTIQFSFISSDSDPGCTWDDGLVFNVSGILSGNQIVNGAYTVSNGNQGIFSAIQTNLYTGRFTTWGNATGSVSIYLASGTNSVAGFVNFTNDPGAGVLCGAGSFVGTRNIDSIQFSFLSNDPDTGCTFDDGLVFNISGTMSGNQLNASYAIPSINEGGSLWANAP